MGAFEGMILMRVTTVACVIEQMIFSEKNRRNQLLRTVFDSYVNIHPTTHFYDPSTTPYVNRKQQNAVADAYRASPRNDEFP